MCIFANKNNNTGNIMEELFDSFWRKVNATPTDFVRSIADKIEWNARLIGIRGARGVGKTTLLLQYIKRNLPLDGSTLYASLDNIWFANNKLYYMARDFAIRGGKNLFLDEVHKYPNWSQEIKNIYDDFPELKVVFTGSSLLEILNARADLSRRAIVYEMRGFSFREYLNRNLGLDLPVVTIDDITGNHMEAAHEIADKVKVMRHFDNYLKTGYYPYYNELPQMYYDRIGEVVNMIIDMEMPNLRGVAPAFTQKVKQLLYVIAESAPFTPNITKLGERIGITRNALLSYINALADSRLTINLHKAGQGINVLQKPDKIFLENTNLMYALCPDTSNKGNVRETFFANQMGYGNKLNVSEQSDFLVNGKYTFEIGGQNKGKRQIKDIPNAYIAADNIEYGYGDKIPLWLFGMTY